MNFARKSHPSPAVGEGHGRKSRAGGVACAFTLTEVLVVAALIGILAAVIGFSLQGGTMGAALNNAQRNLMAALQAVRTNAAVEGVPNRLIIFSDTNEATTENQTTVNGRKLRFYAIISQAVDHQTNLPKPNAWVSLGSGYILPDGVYFVPNVSSKFAQNVPDNINSALHEGSKGPNTSTGVMRIKFGLTEANEGTGDDYYFVEFGPDGMLHDLPTNQANLVVGIADKLSDEEVNFKGNDPQNPNRLFTGVQVRHLGGIVPFRSVDDILIQPTE